MRYRYLICALVMWIPCIHSVAIAEDLPLVTDPLESFSIDGCNPPVAVGSGMPWTGGYAYILLHADLNGDSRDEIFLSTSWDNFVLHTGFQAFVSEGQQFRWQDEGEILNIDPSRCYVGTPEGKSALALITAIKGSSEQGTLMALLDGHTVSGTAIQRDIDTSGESLIDHELTEKYRRLLPDYIPVALRECIHSVQGSVSAYLKERESATYPNPVSDYCLRHKLPFGRATQIGRELLQLEYDINGDGQPEKLLSSTTLEEGSCGYYWEMYTSTPEGYRWQRDTLLLKPDLRMKSGEFIGYIQGEKNQIARLTFGVANHKFVRLNAERLTTDSQGPFDGLPQGYSSLSAARVPFPTD